MRGGLTTEEGGGGNLHLLPHTVPELADCRPPKLSIFSAC